MLFSNTGQANYIKPVFEALLPKKYNFGFVCGAKPHKQTTGCGKNVGGIYLRMEVGYSPIIRFYQFVTESFYDAITNFYIMKLRLWREISLKLVAGALAEQIGHVFLPLIYFSFLQKWRLKQKIF